MAKEVVRKKFRNIDNVHRSFPIEGRPAFRVAVEKGGIKPVRSEVSDSPMRVQ